MTDLTVHARSGSYSFDNAMIDCANEVQRLNPHIYNRQDDQELDEESGEAGVDNPQGAPGEKDLFKYVSLKSRNKEIGSIVIEQELRLMLLRHWTLYDSLCNSNYLVSKLMLWKEHGQKELKKILATLGVSLD